ncbi:MAG: Signal transduction histidine kinase CheA [Labilithrix sp.]|nr:Signal transduction histidine kinase CheA [Labilithrix sp.]
MAQAWAPLRIGGVVHEGVRATVYRAVAGDGEGLPVILKVLTTSFDDAVHRGRLERELAIASRIDSPRVVKALGQTVHEGRLALVLEDFGGEALSRSLTEGVPLPLERALPIASGIARSLAVVHEAGIVHRDIKPSNVIYRPDSGDLKLSDFGVARMSGELAAKGGEGAEGTLAYMAPEQTGRMGRAVDGRADLYSFGVLLYELFTGQRPFQASDPLQWMHSHAALVPRPPSDLVRNFPTAVSDLVLKLLAKAPDERYQSGEGVLHDLEHCFAALQATGTIARFALATSDVSAEFHLPDAMYGREEAVAALEAAFGRVSGGARTEVLLVDGYAGIGKTSLVRTLEEPVARRRGYFAAGKFDQLRRHVPYSAIIEAGTSLVHQLLTTSSERLAAWRRKVLGGLDGNGQVLVDVFPEVERILGRQKVLAELPPGAAQNRLQHAIRVFLRAFDEPLVLFLDDMQWADSASLDVLESVLAQARLPLLVVLAYRDHEVTASHPFAEVTGRLQRGGIAVSALHLGPLDERAVRTLVAETLHTDGEPVQALASLAMAKTAGNPFFLREFIRTLHLDGLLRFDASRRCWTFELSAIEARAITDNVVDLLVERLEQLPPFTREVLRLAAFFGSEAQVDDLAEATGRDRAAVFGALDAATERGLVAVTVRADGGGEMRFGHDRIQQAALALTPEASRPAEHLRVARQWWAQPGARESASTVFQVANHVEAAFALFMAEAGPQERDRALTLFLLAAAKAKSATAYLQASAYFARAAELLGEAGWVDRFELAFDMHVDFAECEYLAGRLDRARDLFAELLRRARSDLERARVYYLEIRLYQVAGDMAEAAKVSVRSFALFGLEIPAAADVERTVSTQLETVAQLLGDRPIETHIDDPPMTDPSVRMLVDLLEASGPPIYMVMPELFSWVALQLVEHSLRYGNAEASCYGYGIYALLRAAVLGDVEGGYACSLLAIRLNERLSAVKLEGCMLHLLGDHVNFWKNPIASDRAILERGFAACVRGGDHIYSNYIGFQAPWHLYEAGTLLTDMAAQIDKYGAFAEETNYGPVLWTLRTERAFVRCLQGETRAAGELSHEGFVEGEALAAVTAARFGCGIVYFHILQMVARYLHGDPAGAFAAAERAAPELGSAFSMPIYTSYFFYRSLVLASLHAEADAATRTAHEAEIATHLATFQRWARTCPANFADKAALLGAELARVKGDTSAALRLYEEARLAARSQGFLQHEALACELGASAYAQLGVDSVKRMLLADALALYRRWGAMGKVTELQSKHRGLERGVAFGLFDTGTTRTGPSGPPLGSPSPLTPGTVPDRLLDLSSVIKAAQSVSAEIVLSRLLPKLMAIVVEYAGAQRGALVLVEGDRLSVAAEAAVDAGAGHAVTSSLAPPSRRMQRSADALPSSVLRYALRTGEAVLIDDAAHANKFGTDPYFHTGVHRSVLCMPFTRHGRMMGMFYLENDLASNAFGPDRLSTLEVLAVQTAISIDNSRLYEESRASVSARDEFLSIASHELRTPLTPLAMQVHRLSSAIRKGTLRDMSDAALEKLAVSCDAQIARMTRLVGALLDASRIESGKMTVQRERTSLADLVTHVVEVHSPQCRAAHCPVRLTVDDGVFVMADRLRIEQVVTNLMLNAVKFGRERPIEIELQRHEDTAHLLVTDHGVGIAPADRARIFERFERVRSSTNVDGLGLGLFIVHAIVEAHDGHIDVESEPGIRTTFRVVLPLAAS